MHAWIDYEIKNVHIYIDHYIYVNSPIHFNP